VNSFRFHVTLDAPTGIIDQADGIPLTYLDKGHAYSVSIVDTAPQHLQSKPTLYRTAIGISFKDKQQRQTPEIYWQLWKEGGKTSKDPERCKRLQAVEYVKPSQFTTVDRRSITVDLYATSLDGFSVL
jgi:hypothetical protein